MEAQTRSSKVAKSPNPGPKSASISGPLVDNLRSLHLPAKTKQLIAVAVAHVTQCPYCIKGHTKAARQHGATPEEIMEAIWVAAEMRAGGAWAHSTLALAELGVGTEKGQTSRG
jgi:AhpD family alkylhydroperoxidase